MKDIYDNVTIVKSMSNAPRSVKLARYLRESFCESDLSSQIMRRGTSIGVNAREALRRQNRADFHSKASFALRGAGELNCWLGPLRQVEYMPRQDYTSMNNDSAGTRKLLTPIVKSISTTNDKNIKTEPRS